MSDWRYEIKYLADERQFNLVLSWMHESRAIFRTAFPPRQVNNIYYDDHAMSAALDNTAGISKRAKVRLRWYGKTGIPGTPVLELKIRKAQLGRKEHFRVPDLDPEKQSLADISRILQEKSPRKFADRVDGFRYPTLKNSYLRQYYAAASGDFRLTIDRQLRFYGLGSASRGASMASVPEFPRAVIELKCDETQRRNLSELLREFPLRPSRNSKYLAGLSGALRFSYF